MVMALKAQCKELGNTPAAGSGTGPGTELAVIRGLPEEKSNISGNYSLALTGWEVPVKALCWVLLSGAEYWER